MMNIVTIGPSTNKEDDLMNIKSRGINFIRLNMSHSSLEDLEKMIFLSKKVGLEFILDTQGPQIRTGEFDEPVYNYNRDDIIYLHKSKRITDKNNLYIVPLDVLRHVQAGDLIHIDNNAVILKVIDDSSKENYLITKAVHDGYIAKNKAVIINSVLEKEYDLPVLSEKDMQSVQLGIKHNIKYIAASYIHSGDSVRSVRTLTENRMKIISKIETEGSLVNLNEIIDESDFLLIDRGDLGKDVPIEKIPFIQKIIIDIARKKKTNVIVATNLLESMVENKYPTRAEIQDIFNTLIDGASGLTLASETAIGKYPFLAINVLNKVIKQYSYYANNARNKIFTKVGTETDYDELIPDEISNDSLIAPHGGKLVNRLLTKDKKIINRNDIQELKLNEYQRIDLEQIAFGAFSPLEGFMKSDDFHSVIENMCLSNGVIWPLPVILDVTEKDAERIQREELLLLTNFDNEIIGSMEVEEKYTYDKKTLAKKIFNTSDQNHPGVNRFNNMKPILIGGKINLIEKHYSPFSSYEITPRQCRQLFFELNWLKIVGFHTRNIPHRAHEYLLLKALNENHCDGILIHPVTGIKKSGDFHTDYILKCYEALLKKYFPKNNTILAGFPSYSRYAGPREALFTAICRQNYGCSHFIIGRDHTGVGDYYKTDESKKIFKRFNELEIKIIESDNIFYNKDSDEYYEENKKSDGAILNRYSISGTAVKKYFQKGEIPPSWIMRPEVSKIVYNANLEGKYVFV